MRFRQKRLFLSDESGAALLEFTVVVPIFIMLTFAIIQYGMLFLTYSGMHNAARETARRWAVADFATEALAEADAHARRSTVADWVPAAYWDCSQTTKLGDILTVTIQVPGNRASILNIPLIPVPAMLTATVVIREE